MNLPAPPTPVSSRSSREVARWFGRVAAICTGALVAIVAPYLVMVFVNSALFSYGFWYDPAPTDTADAVAAASVALTLVWTVGVIFATAVLVVRAMRPSQRTG